MILIYALLMIAMIVGMAMLAKRQRMKKMQPGRGRGTITGNRAHTNEGGNSSRDEQENTATSGDNTGGTLPLGADNDDDRR